jgi:uncharacterized protein YacL
VPDPEPRHDLHPLETAQRQRAILLRFIRAGFVILLVTVTLLNVLRIGPGSGAMDIKLAIGWYIPLSAAITLAAIVIATDLLTPTKKISTLVGVMIGLLVAMLATVALGFVIDLLAATYDIKKIDPLAKDADRHIDFVATAKLLLGICLSYLGITIVLQTKDDFRLIIPYVEFAKQIRGVRPLLLDTSALIDARVADLAQTGIIQSPIVVPRFVIGELQALADSNDKMKRSKGRRGLDVIGKLQRLPTLDISIDDTTIPGKAVDQMLVELAKRMPASILTADLGLKRVAGIQGVPVLNLNDVANSLKPSLIPGEQLSIRLIKPGEQAGQAVGYLADGTMVVAEDGSPHIGHEATLVVTSSLQTSAGRLIFGRIAEGHPPPPPPHSPAAASHIPASPSSAASPEGNGAPAPTEAAADEDAAPDVETRKAAGPFPPHSPNPRFNRARNPRR